MLTARYILLLLGFCSLVTSCGGPRYIYLENRNPAPIRILARPTEPLDSSVRGCFLTRNIHIIDTIVGAEHWTRINLESGDDFRIGEIKNMHGTLIDTNSFFYTKLIIEYDTTNYTEIMKNKKGGGLIMPEWTAQDSLRRKNLVTYYDSLQRSWGHEPGRSVYKDREHMRMYTYPSRNIFGNTTGWEIEFLADMYAMWQ